LFGIFQVLIDNNATKANIIQTLNNLTYDHNDVVFVYYAGHGVFLEDSLDEGLFPTVTKWPLEVKYVIIINKLLLYVYDTLAL